MTWPNEVKNHAFVRVFLSGHPDADPEAMATAVQTVLWRMDEQVPIKTVLKALRGTDIQKIGDSLSLSFATGETEKIISLYGGKQRYITGLERLVSDTGLAWLPEWTSANNAWLRVQDNFLFLSIARHVEHRGQSIMQYHLLGGVPGMGWFEPEYKKLFGSEMIRMMELPDRLQEFLEETRLNHPDGKTPGEWTAEDYNLVALRRLREAEQDRDLEQDI